ncbi:VCBS repeat-containing protein [Bacillus sp. Marseille-Q3570]|uniref:FG-GAP repeat domain-containing protein n=1 Tax=Bacillus sp. Marseille-Q3570 TaxID=2963522 RepID=UPI0021B80E3F|nr:VCBS repeat-containing protein [Bacillus sp. Marseille-Q3570]
MKIDVLSSVDLSNYEIIYLDPSIISTSSFRSSKESLMNFVEKGGYLFLENQFHNQFSKEFIGAESFQDIKSFPIAPRYPKLSEDEKGIQNFLKHFFKGINQHYSKEELSSLTLGKGIIPSKAKSLVVADGLSLYTINEYGKGNVFFSSSLLPNKSFITSFDMKPKAENQEFFNYTFATSNFLLRNEFLSYVAKDMYGYSVSKVLGPNGRPAMAVQNYIDSTSSIKEGAIEKGIDFLKQYNQIPSYSLVREAHEQGVWSEGISYHPNVGTADTPAFTGDSSDTTYTSGHTVKSEGKTLKGAQYPEHKNLGEDIELPYRAYVDFKDVNKDGILDIVSGSGNGQLLFYKGEIADENYAAKKGTTIKLVTGQNIDVGNYSSPILYDMNNDGYLDLVVGMESGAVVTFINSGNFTFEAPEEIVKPNAIHTHSAPAIADINNNGADDLIVGTASGHVYMLDGDLNDNQRTFSSTKVILKDTENNYINVGGFAAPKLVDLNADDKRDLLLGMKEGYIKRFELTSDGLADQGYLEGDRFNAFGNNRLWGGRYSVPEIADLNQDEQPDLVTGKLIYGNAVPIDSDEFKYEQQLRDSLAYAKEHHIKIEPHIFVHNYESIEQEKTEIQLHKKAFDFYGLSWNQIGANQHEWEINQEKHTQTFNSEQQEGIWWNSGFKPPHTPGKPSQDQEYLWVIPFPLMKGKSVENFIINNPAPDISKYKSAYEMYSYFNLPISHQLHIGNDILRKDETNTLTEKVELLNQIRLVHDYNFTTEDRMAKSILSTYKAESTLEYNPIEKVWHDAQNWIRRKLHHSVYITTNADESIEELAGNYQNAIGYKVEMGEKYKGFLFNTDSSVYMYDGTTLYFKGFGKTKLTLDTEKNTKPHIMRSNIPVGVRDNNGQTEVSLLDGGLQQLKVYAPGGLEIFDDSGWDINNEGDVYTLTRYGDPTELNWDYKVNN